MSIALVMPSSHLILWSPLLLLPSIFPSIRHFSNESAVHISWPNYWSFSISPSKEYSRLISLLGLTGLISLQSKGLSGALSSTTVQRHQFFGTLAFFMIQLLQPYMTTGKTTALTMEKAMAPHSSTLAWKIPWMEEPGGLQSMGSWRVGHEESDTERLHFHFSLSCIGEGNGNPLQCSCLENPRDRGAWWAAVYGVAQSGTWLKWLSSSSSTRVFLREDRSRWELQVTQTLSTQA